MKIVCGNNHQNNMIYQSKHDLLVQIKIEKKKLFLFRAVGLHFMWLTWTNLENKDSLQAKRDVFLLICFGIFKEKKSIFAAFKEGQHPKIGHTFCLNSCVVCPWQWWAWLSWFGNKNIMMISDFGRVLLSVTWMNVFGCCFNPHSFILRITGRTLKIQFFMPYEYNTSISGLAV